MLKLAKLVISGAALCVLAFASAATAGSLGLVAGPMPVGNQASYNGAKCVVRAHTGMNRTVQMRRADGTIVASQSGFIPKGRDFVLTASYQKLGRQGSRVVCQLSPVNVMGSTSQGQDVLDAQITLQTLTWYGNTIETVPGVSGAVGSGGPCLPGVCN